MPINARDAKGGGSNIPPVEPGSYPGRLVQVIDFGLQPQSFNGEEKSPMQEIGNTYELSDEFLKDDDGNDIADKPRFLSESFALHNLGADRAKSTARYYAFDPKEEDEGDWKAQLGKPCVLTIIINPGKGANKGKLYNKITGVSAMRPKEAEKLPPLVNPIKFFDLSDPDVEMFKSFPDYIQKKIKSGLEYEGSLLEKRLAQVNVPEDKKKVAILQRGKDDFEEVEIDDEIPTDEDNDPNGGNW